MANTPRDSEAQMLYQLLGKFDALSEHISDMRVQVARIEEEVKALGGDLVRLDKIEQRASELERRFDRALWQLRGAWTVLAALVMVLGYVLGR